MITPNGFQIINVLTTVPVLNFKAPYNYNYLLPLILTLDNVDFISWMEQMVRIKLLIVLDSLVIDVFLDSVQPTKLVIKAGRLKNVLR